MIVAYHSFEGRFSDSPRALFGALRDRVPDAEHVWLADPAHVHGFPEGVRTVTWGSGEGREVLEAADLLVANTHTDTPWTKREGATYLQTWHGTPLKRIHWDVLWAPPGRLERLQGDVDRWDVLLSPNAFSTPNLQGAFRFAGEIAETGYPRNDVLSAPDRDEVRARVRRELGIPEDRTAVLYAPTWRDQEVFDAGGASFHLRFDPERFAERLGGSHVLLLRLHYMQSGLLGTIDHPDVREVSFHPDVAELYLAADVLVTDYSSVMFDFAVTGKPIVLFAYDLDAYRDEVRGFYFDPVPEAPGPVLRELDEVLEAVSDPAATLAAHAPAMAAFRERFCHLEDGGATRRALDVLARRGAL